MSTSDLLHSLSNLNLNLTSTLTKHQCWFVGFPIEVRESAEFGRFVVAARDIQPEELVLYAWPWIATVHHEQCNTVCAYCFSDITVFVRCKKPAADAASGQDQTERSSSSTNNNDEDKDAHDENDMSDDAIRRGSIRPKYQCPLCHKISYCSAKCRDKDSRVHLADECKIYQVWNLDSTQYSDTSISEIKKLVRVLARKTAEVADRARLMQRTAKIQELLELRKTRERERIARRQARYDARVAQRQALKAATTSSSSSSNSERGGAASMEESSRVSINDLDEIEHISNDGTPIENDVNGDASDSDDESIQEIDEQIDDLLAQDKEGNWLGVWDNSHRYQTHYVELIANSSDYPREELASIQYWIVSYVLRLRHWLGRTNETEQELTDIICRNRRNGFGFGNGRHGESQGSGVYIQASLFNHSCEPNVMLRTTGDTTQGPLLVFLAARFIPKGTELTISYLDNGMLHIKLPGAPANSTLPHQQQQEQNDDDGDDDDDGPNPYDNYRLRRKELQDSYFFTCRCTRCTAQEEYEQQHHSQSASTGAVPVASSASTAIWTPDASSAASSTSAPQDGISSEEQQLRWRLLEAVVGNMAKPGGAAQLSSLVASKPARERVTVAATSSSSSISRQAAAASTNEAAASQTESAPAAPQSSSQLGSDLVELVSSLLATNTRSSHAPVQVQSKPVPAAPAPEPTPEPTPEPAPEPAPEPTLEAAPEVEAAPEPAPVAEPTPTPEPAPAPAPAPEAQAEPADGDEDEEAIQAQIAEIERQAALRIAELKRKQLEKKRQAASSSSSSQPQ